MSSYVPLCVVCGYFCVLLVDDKRAGMCVCAHACMHVCMCGCACACVCVCVTVIACAPMFVWLWAQLRILKHMCKC